ncbi:hypothetical protein E2C01_048038 [Portunus trituberculatus]|uniref:Uncharacterized protein n=1 Tax=Portunus trituberculatus TaxID=210409 RepID=A0A5B7G2M2_PORTR|nr:hypothetical protein [Portunus trituberculatus]
MGVIDQELVLELIGIIPTHPLNEVVQHCYAFKAARCTANAITSPSQAVCLCCIKVQEGQEGKATRLGTASTFLRRM